MFDLPINIIASDSVPKGCLLWVPQRKPGESDEEYLGRCVSLFNIGVDNAGV